MKKMLLFTSLLFTGIVTKSEKIEGIVLDSHNEPIVGAEIKVNNKIYYTDFDGKFQIETEEKEIKVGMISYGDKVIPTNCCDTIVLSSF